ncbi:MAG: hypothetical protein ACOX5W_06195 [Bacillota bacterium]|jgi:hypothetical protein
MAKKIKLLASLLTLVVLIMSFPGLANAVPLTGPPPDHQISNDPSKSIKINTKTNISPQGTTLIRQWSCGIEDNNDGTVTIIGETITYGTVDYLDAKVYLQQWNGSGWTNVTNRTYSDSNTYTIYGSSYISVARGYYYRTISTHNARNGGIIDAQGSASDAIFIQ